MKEITLDGNLLADAAQVHSYLKELLELPEYYGNNLDALYDCLTDLENTQITITAPEEDGAIYQKVMRVFKAATRENETLEVIIF